MANRVGPETKARARVLAAEAAELTAALIRGRLPHTCGSDPAAPCHACDIAEDAEAVRRADR